MLVSAAMRLNPQSAMRKLQHRFRRSNPELRGPRTNIEIRPPSTRGVRSAPLLALIPNLPTK
eukprot:7146-Alexandrium_andersonii.AAC.1